MRRTITIFVVLLLGAVSVVGTAFAEDGHHFGRQVRFMGIHPIPKSEGGGMCNIEGPHVHIYAANKLEYRDVEGDAYFVGDPVAYKYDGPKFAYKGPHPIHHGNAVVYCYLEGPHFHYFQPVDDPDMKVVGDAYFYVGAPPQVMIEAKPTYVGINAMYKPYVYARPVVEVEPPDGWIGVRAEFAPPAVVVETPAPVVEVRGHGRGHAVVGAGGVVGVGIGVHVEAPPPPSISIGVGVGVGVSGGAGVRVGGHGRHR
ncbi:MAG: hypothetical protein QM831_23185 [Kofleriaceae bacterium]